MRYALCITFSKLFFFFRVVGQPDIMARVSGHIITLGHLIFSLKQDMHPLSCVAARAAEAARRQGKFWEFHDGLYKVGLNTPQNIVSVAQQLQLDAARFSSEVNSEQVKQRVQTDVELGLKLGITSTPSVYWNGKRITSLSLPLARMLLGKQPVG